MVTQEEINEKYFKKEGLESIENRIKVLIKFFNESNFPVNKMMYGFSSCSFETKEECLQSIKELSMLIGFKCKIESIDNENEKKEVVIY